MPVYWVVGGEYASTRFEQTAEGAMEERLGPFDSYEAAKKAWMSSSWSHVDQCLYRYRIIKDGSTG